MMLIVVERHADVCILSVHGRFVTGTDPYYLQAKIEELKSLGCTKVLADLRDTESIGSTAVGFLVRVYCTATMTGMGKFVIVTANQRVIDILELVHLRKAIQVVSDLDSGLA